MSAPQPFTIRLANAAYAGNAPIFVAEEKRLFAAEGLRIEETQREAGWHSLKRLFERKVGVAMVAYVPIAYSVLHRKKYTETERGEYGMN